MLVEGEPADFQPVTEPARFPLLKRTGIALASLLGLAVVGAFAVPPLLPSSATRELVADAIADATGQPVRIDGEVSLTLLPTFSVEAADLVIGDPAAALLRVRRAAVDLGTLALVSSRMDIHRLSLVEPTLDLGVLAATAEEGGADEGWGWFRGLLVDGFTIEGGRLRYPAPLGGEPITVTAIDLEGGTRGEQELRIAGTARAGDAEGRIDVLLRQPSAFIGGNAVPLNVRFESGDDRLLFEGTFAKRQRYASKGRLTARFADPARLAAWLGNTSSAISGRHFGLTTDLDVGGTGIALSQLDLALGEFQLQGDVAISGKEGDRQISGRLRTSTLHLDPLLATAVADDGTGLLAALPRLFPTGGGELEIAWRHLVAAGIDGGEGLLVLSGDADGRLHAVVDDLDLAGGQARVSIAVGQGEGMTAVEAEVRLIGVEMRELLAGMEGDAPPLSGRANLEVDLLTVGAGREQLVAALTGSGAVTVQGGRLHDAALVEALAPQHDEPSLPFQHMTGSFEIARGILKSEDVLLKAETVSVVAKGEVDLAERAIHFRLDALRPEGSEDRDHQPMILEGSTGRWRIRPAG